MQDKIITFKNYDFMVNALFEQEILRANGIECFINNEKTVELYPMLNNINEGIKLIIFEKDFEKANKILGEYYQSNETNK